MTVTPLFTDTAGRLHFSLPVQPHEEPSHPTGELGVTSVTDRSGENPLGDGEESGWPGTWGMHVCGVCQRVMCGV